MARLPHPLIAWSVAVALAGRASAEPRPSPAPPKPATADYPAAALDKLAEAFVLQLRGELLAARGSYLGSLAASDQANTWFDLALVDAQLDQPGKAIAELDRYLELVTDPGDRAAAERVRETIANAKPTFTIGGDVTDRDEADATIFVDGVNLGPSPARVQVTPGHHLAERVSATGYRARGFDAKPGDVAYVDLAWHGNQTGNVVISGTFSDDRRREGGPTEPIYQALARITLPIGHWKLTQLYSQGAPGHFTCTPVVFDVTSMTTLLYVRVELDTTDPHASCTPITAIHLTQFPFGAP